LTQRVNGVQQLICAALKKCFRQIQRWIVSNLHRHIISR